MKYRAELYSKRVQGSITQTLGFDLLLIKYSVNINYLSLNQSFVLIGRRILIRSVFKMVASAYSSQPDIRLRSTKSTLIIDCAQLWFNVQNDSIFSMLELNLHSIFLSQKSALSPRYVHNIWTAAKCHYHVQ